MNHSRNKIASILAVVLLHQSNSVPAVETISEPYRTFGLGNLTCMAYAPDGKHLATGSDPQVYLWDVETRQIIRIFTGHTTAINSVAFSPDGQRLASGGDDRILIVWDVSTGDSVLNLNNFPDKIRVVIYSPDGSAIAVGCADGTVSVWNAQDGSAITTFQVLGELLSTLIYTPDGTRLLTGAHSTPPMLWDARTGQFLRYYEKPTEDILFQDDFESGALQNPLWKNDEFHPWFGVATTDRYGAPTHAVRSGAVHGVTDSVLELSLNLPAGGVLGFDYRTPINTWYCFAYFEVDGEGGQFYDKNWNQHYVRLEAGQHTIRWIYHVFEDSPSLVNSYFEIGNITISKHFPDLNVDSSALTVSQNGTWLLAGGAHCIVDGGNYDPCSGFIRVWELESGLLIREEQYGEPVTSIVTDSNGNPIINERDPETWDVFADYEGHTRGVLDVAFSPGGQYVLTGGGDGYGRLWDVESGKQIQKYYDGIFAVYAVAYSPDGSKILTANDVYGVKLWDAASGTRLHTFGGNAGLNHSICFSPDGTKILTSSHTSELLLWTIEPPELIRRFSGHQHSVGTFAFSPDGTKIVTGSWDRTAKIWDVETGSVLLTTPLHDNTFSSVIFSPDGNRFLTVCEKTIRIWQTSDGSLLNVLDYQNVQNWIQSVEYSSDGQRLLKGTDDGDVMVVDAGNGEVLVQCQTQTTAVSSVMFSPDQNLLIGGYYDGIARLWRISTTVGDWLQK